MTTPSVDYVALARTVAHDMKGHLAVIQAYTELLQRLPALSQDEKGQRYVEKVLNKTKSLDHFIHQISDFIKCESGVVPFSPQPCRVAETLHQALESIKLKHPNQPFAKPPESNEVTLFDPQWLQSVFTIVLENAATHGGAPTPVQLEITSHSQSLVVSILDDGPGIDESERSLLFTPLFQSRNTRLQQKGGGGLGLAIAQRVLQAHGGELGYEARKPTGSRFLIAVPRELSQNS